MFVLFSVCKVFCLFSVCLLMFMLPNELCHCRITFVHMLGGSLLSICIYFGLIWSCQKYSQPH